MVMWNEVASRFEHVTDKLGKKIDTGIFDTVVALNVLGITTVQSCEGHVGWGVPYPWVHIESSLEQKFRLHQLLSQFYERRSTDFESVLVFNGYRMHSRGAAFSEIIPETEHVQRLQLYQEEMRAFTSYLKMFIASPATFSCSS